MVATYLPTTLYNVLNGANIQSLVAVGRLSAAGMRHFDPLIGAAARNGFPPQANRPQRLAEACQSPSARRLNEQRGELRAKARTPLRSNTKDCRKIPIKTIKNLDRTQNHAKITHKLCYRAKLLILFSDFY